MSKPAQHVHNLAEFTNSNQSGSLRTTRTDLAPGIFLNADPKLELTGFYSSRSGHFLDLCSAPSGEGAWLGLHIALRLPPITDVTYIGFASRIASDTPLMMRACLRSGIEGGNFRDSFFEKHILTDRSAQNYLDALYLDSVPDLPLTSPWHELVVFLPCDAFEMTIMNMHIFVL